MKKFIKRLILLLIILGCLIGIYYYKDETVKQIQSISENLNNLEILEHLIVIATRIFGKLQQQRKDILN